MKLPDMGWPWVAYFWAGCIWLGSVAHTCLRMLLGEDVTIAGMVLQLVVASFAGLLAVLLSSRFGWTGETTGIICGIAGWSGSQFIAAIERRVLHGVSGHKK
ncbi:phage holin family protein [Hafnia paralvei]